MTGTPDSTPITQRNRATLVSLAGLDGAGKTTQTRLLARWLAQCGHCS